MRPDLKHKIEVCVFVDLSVRLSTTIGAGDISCPPYCIGAGLQHNGDSRHSGMSEETGVLVTLVTGTHWRVARDMID